MTSLFVSPSTIEPIHSFNYNYTYSIEDLPKMAADAAATDSVPSRISLANPSAVKSSSSYTNLASSDNHQNNSNNHDINKAHITPRSSFMSTLGAPRSPMSPPRHPVTQHTPHSLSSSTHGHPPIHPTVSVTNLQEKNLQLSRALSISKKMHDLERAEYDHKVAEECSKWQQMQKERDRLMELLTDAEKRCATQVCQYNFFNCQLHSLSCHDTNPPCYDT